MELEVKKLVDIDVKMADFFREVAKSYGLFIKPGVAEKIMADSLENMVNEKKYEIAESNKWLMHGKVDEYEPESIWVWISKK